MHSFVSANTIINRYGKRSLKKYQAYRNANTKIGELILRVEGYWLRVENPG